MSHEASAWVRCDWRRGNIHLDAALANRMTPGRSVPPVGFTVVARGGLSVLSEGAGVRLECSGRMHRCVGAEEELSGGSGWPRAELVKWAGPKQFLFPLINVFFNLHQKLPAQKYIT
jgi:hypothetical protein